VEIKQPKLVFLEGENKCPYRWSTGEMVGAFLTALRDHRKILGGVCTGCGAVIVPPSSYCETCSSPVEEMREVGPRGVVMTWARVPEPFDDAPLPAPFRYVLVRLAGSDTSMVHVAPDDDNVRVGAILIPEFREERWGSITDIKWFVPEGNRGPEDSDD